MNEWKVKRSILNRSKYKKIKLCYSYPLKHFPYVTFLGKILINDNNNPLKIIDSSKGGLIRWNFSFAALKFLFRKKSVEIFQEVKYVSWNSYDHNNVSFIEWINNFYFSCHRHYSFKSCLRILKKHYNYVVSDWGKIRWRRWISSKKKKRSVWMKPWLKKRLRTSAYQHIFQELRLKDKE